MTLQATGVEWSSVYGFNPLGIRKGLIVNVLVRDYAGADTNLKDAATGLNTSGIFTPYAADGLYRDDLLDPAFPGGQWFDVGSLSDAGVKITPNMSVEGVKIAQARRAQRWDVTDEDDEIQFVCRESNNIVDALRDDLPLATVTDNGAAEYTVIKAAESALIERQFIAFAEDGKQRWAYVFPRAAKKKAGTTSLNRKDSDDLDLTYGALICPFADTPRYLVRDGEGWRANDGVVIRAASETKAAAPVSKPAPKVDTSAL